jgi:restriction system protein
LAAGEIPEEQVTAAFRHDRRALGGVVATYLVRAGENGRKIVDFEKGVAAIGWHELGRSLSEFKSVEELKAFYPTRYPNADPKEIGRGVNTLWKFKNDIRKGDPILTYSPKERLYLLGEVVGDYEFVSSEEYQHVHKVKWSSKVSRDALSLSSRNALGSLLTMFEVSEQVVSEIREASKNPKVQEIQRPSESKAEFKIEKETEVQKARELLKDRILGLSPDQMEELAASILRALGYQARRSGSLNESDRGKDVTASKDGLGLDGPRIKVEVKHRPGSQMGRKDVSSFIGALRGGDRGLFISTGGFSKEAHYEAERAQQPITLLDLDELAEIVVANYEKFDTDGKTLLPLTRIYWPAE